VNMANICNVNVVPSSCPDPKLYSQNRIHKSSSLYGKWICSATLGYIHHRRNTISSANLRDMAKTTKYTYVTIFLNIQMNYVKVNTITLWFTIAVINAKTNSHNITCNTWTQRLLLQQTTDLHQGKRSTELSKVFETFSAICCFMLPETLKVP
jgi:hypothetical protein